MVRVSLEEDRGRKSPYSHETGVLSTLMSAKFAGWNGGFRWLK
jgi:hypothetical protein